MTLLAFEEVRKNKARSNILLIFFIILIGVLGSALGLYWENIWLGVIVSMFGAVIYSLAGWFSGDSWILAMSGAKIAEKKEFPYLVNAVEGLAISAGLPTPKVYVINDSALNAFATGRDPKNASITVTTGLLKTMNREELEGVLAHEMSHIGNYDIRFMMLTVILVGIVTLLSDFLLRSFLWGGKNKDKQEQNNMTMILIVIGLVLAILSPLIAELIKLAISRKREFSADANGAILTRYPQGLANALKKIANDPDPLVDHANKATAHLFISTPFRNEGGMARLFSTHPPIQERIKRLEEM